MIDEADEHGFWDDGRATGRVRRHDSTGPIPRLSRSNDPTGAMPVAPSRRHVATTAENYAYDTADGGYDITDGVTDHVDAAASPQDRFDNFAHELRDHGPEASLVRSRVVRERPHQGGGPRSRMADNPFWRRIGALFAIGLVAAPAAMIVRGGDDSPRLDAAPVSTDFVALGPVPGVPTSTTIVATVVPSVATVVAESAASVAQPPSTAAATTPAVSIDPPTTVAPTTAAAAPPPAKAAGVGAAQTVTAAGADLSAANDAVQAVTQTTVTRVCAKKYEVVAGDYWILIAKKVSVDLADVLSVNGANVSTAIYPGRTVCLPADASTPTTAAPATTPPPTTAAPTTVRVTATTTPPTTAPPITAPAATATTAAPTTTEAPPPNTYTKAQAEAIIREVWPDDLEEKAVSIAWRESNLIPTVRNYCCFGLFQIYWNMNKATLIPTGVTSAAQLYDPRVNATAAYAIYLRAGGWGPWAL